MIVHACRPFGASVTGLQLQAAGQRDADYIVGLIGRHRVVVLPDQTADDAALVSFLARLGDLMFTDGETPVAGAPDLNLVSNVGRTTPPRSVFHTDTSYVAAPPAFTALRAVTVPAAGGGTLFSDQAQAAAALPPRARAWLTGRTLLHSTTGPDGCTHEARHPVLQRHLLTGEVSLYLSTPARCTSLSGVDARTSARIVALLYRRSIRPAGLYRHAWRPGDVLIWDDRTTMHRADHSAVVGDRILHRGLVRGAAPVAA